MGIFLVSLVVLVLGIIMLAFNNRYHFNGLDVLGISLSVVGGVSSLVSTMIALSYPDTNSFNSQYEEVLSDIDIVNYTDTVNVRFVSDLEDKVNIVNKTIANNREYEGTFWLGWYYSSKIGDCEYIEMPKFKNIKYNY